MVPGFAHVRRLAVFIAALIAWNQPASAASVLTLGLSDYGHYPSEPYFFYKILFDETLVSYNRDAGGQTVPVISATIDAVHEFPGQRRDVFYDAYGDLFLSDMSPDGYSYIQVNMYWERGPEFASYWLTGSGLLYPNPQTSPNLLVEGDWRGTDDISIDLLHSHEDYDYREGAYYSLINVSIAPVSQVPEPRTWGLLLLGFGAVGSAIRRRRAKLTIKGAQAAPLALA